MDENGLEHVDEDYNYEEDDIHDNDDDGERYRTLQRDPRGGRTTPRRTRTAPADTVTRTTTRPATAPRLRTTASPVILPSSLEVTAKKLCSACVVSTTDTTSSMLMTASSVANRDEGRTPT